MRNKSAGRRSLPSASTRRTRDRGEPAMKRGAAPNAAKLASPAAPSRLRAVGRNKAKPGKAPGKAMAPKAAVRRSVKEAPRKAIAKAKAVGGSKPRVAVKTQARPQRRARPIRKAKFSLGQVVRHRIYPFRGVVFDIDPVFSNTEEWLAAIPAELRPKRNQPFYHLLAESAETEYVAYVSEQNLLPDNTGTPLRHTQITEYFVENDDGSLRAVYLQSH